ncbi:MAG: hypothetical protein ACLUFF_02700 [Acutalibacteraceae bacterium]
MAAQFIVSRKTRAPALSDWTGFCKQDGLHGLRYSTRGRKSRNTSGQNHNAGVCAIGC